MLTSAASSSSSFICRAILEVLTSTSLSLSCLKSSGRATEKTSVPKRWLIQSEGWSIQKMKQLCPFLIGLYHLNAPLPRISFPVFAQGLAFLPPVPLWLLTARSERKIYSLTDATQHGAQKKRYLLVIDETSRTLI